MDEDDDDLDFTISDSTPVGLRARCVCGFTNFYVEPIVSGVRIICTNDLCQHKEEWTF